MGFELDGVSVVGIYDPKKTGLKCEIFDARCDSTSASLDHCSSYVVRVIDN